MSKKKNGTLQFTAEDCRKSNARLKDRYDYDKISKALGLINEQIEQTLKWGGKSVQIGRTSPDHTVFIVLVYSYHWENTDSIYLSDKEWNSVVKTLQNSGFAVTKKDSKYTLSWSN